MLNNGLSEIPPGQFPYERRLRTDTLCLHFSWPLFFMIFQVFLLVIIYGRTFSFIHPPDTHGLRCGFDNSLLFPNFSDFSNQKYLSFKRKCVEDCSDGSRFLSYCIPLSRKELNRSPLEFKVINDFLEYWKFAFLMVLLTLIFAFPIYCICAKFSLVITYLLLVLVSVVSVFICIKSLVNHFYSIAFDAFFFGTGYVLLLFYIRNRIHIIGPLVTTSFKYLNRSRSSFLAPFFIIGVSILVLIFVALGVLFTNGVAQPTTNRSKTIIKTQQHFSLQITKFLFPFLGLWLIEFFFVWVRFAVSYITASIYFNHAIPTLGESMQIGLTYHAGTIFFGSFVVFFLEGLSTFFVMAKKWMKNTKNSFVKFVCKCLINICFIIIKFVGEINRLSFVFTSLEGTSFWDGCKKAASTLQIDSILSIDLLMYNIFFGAKVLISSFVGIITFRYIYVSMNDGELILMMSWVPIVVIPLLVYFVLSSADVVVGASSQTLLICMLEDAKEEDGAYAPKELQHIMKWLKERVPNASFTA